MDGDPYERPLLVNQPRDAVGGVGWTDLPADGGSPISGDLTQAGLAVERIDPGEVRQPVRTHGNDLQAVEPVRPAVPGADAWQVQPLTVVSDETSKLSRSKIF